MHVLATVNTAALNIGVHVYFTISVWGFQVQLGDKFFSCHGTVRQSTTVNIGICGDQLFSQGLKLTNVAWKTKPFWNPRPSVLTSKQSLHMSPLDIFSIAPSCPKCSQVRDWLSNCARRWNVSIYMVLGEISGAPACYPTSGVTWLILENELF